MHKSTTSERALSQDQADRLRRLVAMPSANGVAAQRAVGNGMTNGASSAAPLVSEMSVGPEGARASVRPVRLARAIAVSSGKGGVGKTNLAVNLAAAFAAQGKRVALLDADLGLANADVLCGLTPRATLEDVLTGDATIDEVAVSAPGGFRLIPGASGVSRLADMGQLQRRSVLEQLVQLERSVDVLIVDTGAGIGTNSMAFAAAAHTVLVATTPEPTAIADAYGAIKTLVARGVREGILLVVNMAMNPDEGKLVHARMDRVCRAFLNVRIAYGGSVPYDQAVPKAVRRREPLLIGAPDAPASRAIRRVAQVLAGDESGARDSANLAEARAGFLARLSAILSRR
jgi:flagellar biosynthesis protein FlhG